MSKPLPISRYLKLGIIAAVLMFGISTCYGPPKFWWNYEGWNEADVTARLGKPYYDSRVHSDDKPGQPYTLGWYHGVGNQLGLKFAASGKVVAQWRGTK